MTKLSGRTAIVTGAARGIGQATARRLASDGAAVLVVDVLDDEGEAVAAAIRSDGGTARYLRCDVSREGDWQAVREVCLRDFGGADILHSNAFVQRSGPLHELDRAGWDRVLAVNLTACYLGVRTFVSDLTERRGSIVITSSVHALMGLPGNGAYAATKGALTALTRELAAEYGPAVRVNAVLPGPIETPAWADADATTRDRAARATALGRLGNPDEVAAAVAFLAGPEASYITGTSLLVDGGWSITKDSP